MSYEIKLKNSKHTVTVDDHVYEHLCTDPYLVQLGLINNLRRHSSGCAVFQKSWNRGTNLYQMETIYLHRYIAQKFLPTPTSTDMKLVGAKNGNKLDCRLKNLEWETRSTLSRRRSPTSKTGFRGVYFDNKRFRAIITINGKTMHIGMFDTAEEAARAYNKKALEVLGENANLNKIK